MVQVVRVPLSQQSCQLGAIAIFLQQVSKLRSKARIFRSAQVFGLLRARMEVALPDSLQRDFDSLDFLRISLQVCLTVVFNAD
jgi:hypothetical protein